MDSQLAAELFHPIVSTYLGFVLYQGKCFDIYGLPYDVKDHIVVAAFLLFWTCFLTML